MGRAYNTASDEQGVHQRRNRSRRRSGPEAGSPLPAGSRNYMTPGGFARLRSELDASARRASGPSSSRRSRGRRATAIGPRTAITSTARSGCARSTGAFASWSGVSTLPKSSTRRRARDDDSADQVFFGATVRLRNAAGAAANDQHRRRRRDRHRARVHQLGVADGARAHQGARRRHGDACARRVAPKTSRSSRCVTPRLRPATRLRATMTSESRLTRRARAPP